MHRKKLRRGLPPSLREVGRWDRRVARRGTALRGEKAPSIGGRRASPTRSAVAPRSPALPRRPRIDQSAHHRSRPAFVICERDRWVSNFAHTPSVKRAHLPPNQHQTRRGEWRGAMQNSGCCRSNAAECLLAAQEASQPYYRKLRLSMAVSWLSLARQYEARVNPLASWDTPWSGRSRQGDGAGPGVVLSAVRPRVGADIP
jgi:hypothetical protein